LCCDYAFTDQLNHRVKHFDSIVARQTKFFLVAKGQQQYLVFLVLFLIKFGLDSLFLLQFKFGSGVGS
jgi:hypothetical protein